jgi:hypothetical protein
MKHTGSTTGMEDGNPERVPWDDRAALEELERLHGAIDEWRARRKQAQAAFEEFVRGFRTPPREREIGAASFHTAGQRASSQPLLTSDLTAPVHAESLISSNVDVPPQWSVPPDQRRKRPAHLVAIAGGVAAMITAGALLIQSWRATRAESSATRTDAAVQIPRSAVPTAPPNSRPAEPAGPGTEIIALRRVWVRVIVDGTREVEGELHANERVPLRAGRTIVIRTGDAGAIRLTMNGQDRGTLGRDGEVVTRTLKTPAPPNR